MDHDRPVDAGASLQRHRGDHGDAGEVFKLLLAGDAAKEYPYLAAIPTPAWKNSISAIDGALYLIPIHRQMTSVPPQGGNFFRNVDMWDKELGQDYTPNLYAYNVAFHGSQVDYAAALAFVLAGIVLVVSYGGIAIARWRVRK